MANMPVLRIQHEDVEKPVTGGAGITIDLD
jgi:hypothetical protein